MYITIMQSTDRYYSRNMQYDYKNFTKKIIFISFMNARYRKRELAYFCRSAQHGDIPYQSASPSCPFSNTSPSVLRLPDSHCATCSRNLRRKPSRPGKRPAPVAIRQARRHVWPSRHEPAGSPQPEHLIARGRARRPFASPPLPCRPSSRHPVSSPHRPARRNRFPTSCCNR